MRRGKSAWGFVIGSPGVSRTWKEGLPSWKSLSKNLRETAEDGGNSPCRKSFRRGKLRFAM